MAEYQKTTRFPTPSEIEEKREQRNAPLLQEALSMVQRQLEESEATHAALVFPIKYTPVLFALQAELRSAGWGSSYAIKDVLDQRGEVERKEIRLEVSPLDENS